tara:strand:+ start:1206 stop:1463 length:258 start_codon:yes stop_codon:yes gene_type:complete
MKAINNYVIVKKFKKELKQESGLILTEELSYDDTYARANVISVGNMVEGLKEGDVVHYDSRMGHNLPWKGDTYRVIKNLDVVLVE